MSQRHGKGDSGDVSRATQPHIIETPEIKSYYKRHTRYQKLKWKKSISKMSESVIGVREEVFSANIEGSSSIRLSWSKALGSSVIGIVASCQNFFT
jgi:hypothetical protein